MAEIIRDFWAVIAAVVAAVVWLVRLEARGISNAAEIRRLWAQRKEDLELQSKAREETSHMLSEIRADIKALLREVKR